MKSYHLNIRQVLYAPSMLTIANPSHAAMVLLASTLWQDTSVSVCLDIQVCIIHEAGYQRQCIPGYTGLYIP